MVPTSSGLEAVLHRYPERLLDQPYAFDERSAMSGIPSNKAQSESTSQLVPQTGQ